MTPPFAITRQPVRAVCRIYCPWLHENHWAAIGAWRSATRRHPGAPAPRIVRAMHAAAEREYRDACEAPAAAAEGPERELWPSRVVGWLSREDLARVNALLAELNSVMSRQRSGPNKKLYALPFSLAPLTRAIKPSPEARP